MMRALFAALLLIVPGAVFAQEPSHTKFRYPRAQRIVDEAVIRHPGMLDAILHVSPAAHAPNIVVAAHLRHAIGEASGSDDLGVAATSAPLVEIQKDGRRLGVLVQLRDRHHLAIGALGLMYAYRPGDDVEASVLRSFAIRDAMERQIPSLAVLVADRMGATTL